jgi:hypothetical protein
MKISIIRVALLAQLVIVAVSASAMPDRMRADDGDVGGGGSGLM